MMFYHTEKIYFILPIYNPIHRFDYSGFRVGGEEPGPIFQTLICIGKELTI
jgi:hypothetical protein